MEKGKKRKRSLKLTNEQWINKYVHLKSLMVLKHLKSSNKEIYEYDIFMIDQIKKYGYKDMFSITCYLNLKIREEFKLPYQDIRNQIQINLSSFVDCKPEVGVDIPKGKDGETYINVRHLIWPLKETEEATYYLCIKLGGDSQFYSERTSNELVKKYFNMKIDPSKIKYFIFKPKSFDIFEEWENLKCFIKTNFDIDVDLQ